MLVYGASMSPFVRKVLVFAAEKGLALENKPVGLGDQDPAFRAASPFGKIPGFRDGDFAICDSSAIIAYLDAIAPEPNLIPTAPRTRAMTVYWEEFADGQLMEVGRQLFFNRVVAPLFLGREGDAAMANAAEATRLPPLLDHLESRVPDGGGFLVEDRITLADIAVASPLANLTRHLGIGLERHPRVRAYAEAILARPSFATWIEKEGRLLAKVRAAKAAEAGPAEAVPADA